MELFKIPEQNIPLLEKKLASISKRGMKMGTGPITLTVLTKTVTENKDGTVSVFSHVTFDGEAPKINGWKFLARIDHNNDRTGASNLIYSAPHTDLPEEYRNNAADCQHCDKIRKRRDTFILENEATGELKQVGRTCIKDFIGHDPEMVLRMFEYLRQAAAAAKEYTGEPVDMGSNRIIKLDMFLTYVVHSIRCNGWISKGKAFDEFNRSTCADALDSMFPVNKAEINKVITTDKDRDIAKFALQHVLALDKSENDYIHNIVTIAETGYVDWKATGYAASIVRVYQKDLENKEEEKNRIDTSGSQHVGANKDRIKITAKVIFKKTFESYYGTTRIVKMFSDDGNVFITFATGDFNPDMNDDINIRGTVKKHQDYKGEKQTVLNRVKQLV